MILKDSNECTDGSNTCLDDIYCHNTVGNYYCSCPSGYLKDATDPYKCHGKFMHVHVHVALCTKLHSIKILVN